MEWMDTYPQRLPTPEEILQIKEEIQSMDSEIASLQIYLSRLKKDRENKAAFIAPFRRLPLEILGEIARFSLEMGEPPSTLNTICSSMRAAVNGMKALWTTMHYHTKPHWLIKQAPISSPVSHCRGYSLSD
jgi:hypothetical protein